jgi:hypothetical protein
MTSQRALLAGEPRLAHVLSALAGGLLVVISVCGLLLGGRGLYDPDPALRAAFQAQDAVTLLLALPLLAASMWLTRRGSARGLLLWAGMLLYVVYWYYFYVVGARFNPLFLAYVAVDAAALVALGALVVRVDVTAVGERFAADSPARAIGGFLVAMALLFTALWCADVVRRLRLGQPLDVVSRHVYAIDLSALLPLMLAAGVLVWRRRPWGYLLAGPLLVKAASSGIMLLAGTAAQAWHGIVASPGQVAAYALVATGGLTFAAVYFRAIERPGAAAVGTDGATDTRRASGDP